jgi:hypothetical protein
MLHIPAHTLLSRPPPPEPAPQSRIPNPIPQDKIETFNTLLFETHNDSIQQLIDLLRDNPNLTPTQWQSACAKLDSLITDISRLLQSTCAEIPTAPLQSRIATQGGFLPQRAQKLWKKHLKQYHTIRKEIYVIHHHPHRYTHPAIAALNSLPGLSIFPPPAPPLPIDSWLTELATLAKKARTDARNITTKQTQINC